MIRAAESPGQVRVPAPLHNQNSIPSGHMRCSTAWLLATHGLAVLLHKLRYQASPTSLMTGPNPRAIVSVKVFVEHNQISPIWIGLKFLYSPKHRTPPVRVLQEN